MTSDDVGLDDPTESNTRSHAVVLKVDISEIIEHLPCIQERRNLKIRCRSSNLRSHHVNTLFDTQRDEILIDEAIDSIASQIVLPAQ